MKRRLYLLAALLLAFVLGLTACGQSGGFAPAKEADRAIAKMAAASPGKLLDEGGKFPPGDSVSDWLAFALCIGGVKEDYSGYLERLEKYITDSYADGTVSVLRATEFHRMALTVQALGKDPQSFGRDRSGSPVNLIAEGVWNYEELDRQGLNGPIFALIVLDSGGYEPPADSAVTRESLIRDIVSKQEEDGGFGLTAGSSETDITAMALQALAPYQAQCAEAVEKALTFLEGRMLDNCGFESYGQESVESIDQVILALCALGIDPDTDARFMRGSLTMTDALQTYYRDGCYSHTPDGKADVTATTQTLLALTACERLREGKPFIYRFADE